MSELLPCPHCGGDGFLLTPTCNRKTPYNPLDRAFPLVRCKVCGAEAIGENWDQRGTSAIAAWNRRAYPEVSEAEVERALDAIEHLRDELAQWCEAYPTDLFPEPEPTALKWLHDTKPGLCDEISAKMGRHMVARIRPMLDSLSAALTAARGTPPPDQS